MISSAFIIPCKYSKEVPILFNCLKSIRKHHPSDEIFVVDSNSDDKSYFNRAEQEFGAIVLDAKNNNYLTGAIWHVFNNYKRDFYYCFHDSVELLASLESLKDNNVSPLMYHKHWQWPKNPETNDRVSEWSRKQIEEKTSFGFKDKDFYILQGAMICCKKEVLCKLAECGFDKVLPSNKYQEECTERLWGLALGELGYNKEIKQNSILGLCRQGQGLGSKFISSIADGGKTFVYDGITYYSTHGGYHLGNTDKVKLDGIPFVVKRNKSQPGDRMIKYWCSAGRK